MSRVVGHLIATDDSEMKVMSMLHGEDLQSTLSTSPRCPHRPGPARRPVRPHRRRRGAGADRRRVAHAESVSDLGSILDQWFAEHAEGVARVVGVSEIEDGTFEATSRVPVADPRAVEGPRVRPGRAHRPRHVRQRHRRSCRPLRRDDPSDPAARHPRELVSPPRVKRERGSGAARVHHRRAAVLGVLGTDQHRAQRLPASLRRQQPTRWSSTTPQACMVA